MSVAPRRPRDDPSAAKVSAPDARVRKPPGSANRVGKAGPWIAGVLVALLIGSGAGMVWLVLHPRDERGSAGSFGGALIGGPFALTDGSGKGRYRQRVSGPFFAGLFRLHVLPGRLSHNAQ